MAYRILSIDGGGVKGVFALQLLKLIEEEVDREFIGKVDCIAGTSTGALIAVALALGFSPQKLLFFYKVFGHKIFSSRSRDVMKEAKYDNSHLRDSMLKVLPKNPTFSDIQKDLIIPAFRLEGPEGERWKEEIYDSYRDDMKGESLIDVALRSSSAPLYFPSYQGRIDGGVYALNPSLLSLTRAIDPTGGGRSLKEIRILSLGNGVNPSKISQEIDWGVMNWMTPYQDQADLPLFSLLTEMGASVPHYPLTQILKDRYLRINEILPFPIEIDDLKHIKDLRKAAKSIKENNPDRWREYKAWIRNAFLP